MRGEGVGPRTDGELETDWSVVPDPENSPPSPTPSGSGSKAERTGLPGRPKTTAPGPKWLLETCYPEHQDQPSFCENSASFRVGSPYGVLMVRPFWAARHPSAV